MTKKVLNALNFIILATGIALNLLNLVNNESLVRKVLFSSCTILGLTSFLITCVCIRK